MSMPSITVVHAPACHFCVEAREVLDELAQNGLIQTELVEADSATGLALVDAHRPTMFPLVLVDGAFFSQGRLPRRKLAALLASRSAVSPR